MARLAALAAVLALSGLACGGGETVTVTRSEARTVTETETVAETATETVTETETVAGTPAGLPPAVAQTHAALLEAAESDRYRALRPFIPARFSYTFGSPAPGGPIAYWRRVERQTGERPIEILARVLRLPYTLFGGTYVWPFAYDKQEDELTGHERELLGDLADAYSGAGSGYLGWRAGIEPDGTWRFFIAGD